VQIPDACRHGVPVLVRADGAGCSKAFLAHIRGLRDQAVATEFTVGWAVTDRERHAIDRLPARAWTSAIDADGRHRDGAHVAELTGLLPAGTLADYPPGTRILVRRERPHPGAQLDAFEDRDGWRYQCLATDTAVGQLAFLDARHRAHARVEDRIRTGKDTGLGRFPSRTFAINAAWLTAVMLAVDLISWAQTILLHDAPGLVNAEPKTLRYRLLHVAARLVRGGRRLRLRLDNGWPWAAQLAAAYARCAALPQPAP
jgi:Transposase DDE domain group 1